MNDITKKRKLLLIGWDAADWKVINPLMDNGELPNLAKLVEGGIIGNLATLKPVFSPMLWTSIATGKRAHKHGIYGFTEPDPHGAGVRPITNLSRRCKAVWNILNQENLQSNVVGWWPSHPAEPINGVMVSDHYKQFATKSDGNWPLPRGAVHPNRLRKPLKELRVHPYELEAEHLLPFVPQAAKIDQDKDKRLMAVAKAISECSTIHAAATGIMQLEPWDFMAVYYDAIDHFCHGFMRFHPPKLDWVSDEDFEMYSDVINSAYRFHDMMLGVLMTLAGDDTTIMLISDHGFHSDHLRPRNLPNEPAGPAAEHRDYGIFVLNGPGVKKDETVFGATLLDITPTILSLFGLPIGKDMDGRALLSVYEKTPEIKFIDSWDSVEGNTGQHPPDMQLAPEETRESIDQLVALGYIDEPDENAEKAALHSIRELDDNLARSFIDASRHADAAQILESLWEQWPDETRFGIRLLGCQIRMQMVEAARATLDKIKSTKSEYSQSARAELDEFKKQRQQERESKNEENTDNENLEPEINEQEMRRLRRLASRATTNIHALAFLESSVLEMEGQIDNALVLLRKAAATEPAYRNKVLRKIGELNLKKRSWEDARKAFEAALNIDPNDFHAMTGISRYYLNKKDYTSAAEYASGAIGLLFNNPQAHYYLGVAMYRQGQQEVAVKAMQMAVRQNPNFPTAHRRLAIMLRKQNAPIEEINFHRRRATESRKKIATMGTMNTQENGTQHKRLDLNELAQKTRTGIINVAPKQVINIVSGLPRSGTSMLMQMLDKGGAEILTDGIRVADESNPRGFYEYDKVKGLAKDRSWLSLAKGKVVKVVAPLIPLLPAIYRYRVIFLVRPLEEILKSQFKMLERMGKEVSTSLNLSTAFEKQLQNAIRWADQNRQVEYVGLGYHEVLRDPIQASNKISDFLKIQLDANSMACCVDQSLYRSKS